MTDAECRIANGSALPLADVPRGDYAALRSFVLEKVAGGSRLAAYFPVAGADGTELLAVLTHPDSPLLSLARAAVGQSFPSLTPECPQAHLFEREMAEQWGLAPLGHPWLKPVRFSRPLPGKGNPDLPKDFRRPAGPSVTDFYRVSGEEVHEVAVGPVHAGVIEPGHFRFQCHGEKVMHLEISLGYQHRGVEKKLLGGPDRLTPHLIETAAGDTACGHGLAHAMVIEALAGIEVSAAAHRLRAVALELERIANHTGDLGALAGDVGFLPTANFCGRLRGDILNLTALLCGNRFGRGLVLPGGAAHGLDGNMAAVLSERLGAAMRDIRGAVNLMFAQPSALARFEGTGRVDAATADSLGLVGPAARASGLATDVRCDQPAGAYALDSFQPAVGINGDVLDRARLRQSEADVSAAMIDGWLRAGAAAEPVDPRARRELRPESVAVGLSEGWRGRVCHVAVTGPDGRFAAYKIVDPSFFNWTGLAMALRGQQISDFPLCNKSFNLSYCGHDL